MSSPKTNRPLNDIVYTNPLCAQAIVEHFKPFGQLLDPCRGQNAFYNALNDYQTATHQHNQGFFTDWCEIEQHKDFLTYIPPTPIDWIISNFPWSSKAYRSISRKAFQISDNVVSLVRLHNAIGTQARIRDAQEFNHQLKEVLQIDWKFAGFPNEGFFLGAFHWQKNYQGGTKWTLIK